MGEKALWPTVVVIGMVLATVGFMSQTLDVVAMLAILGVLFTGVSSLIGILLYGKLIQVEKNTNGLAGEDKKMMQKLFAVVAKAQPVDSTELD